MAPTYPRTDICQNKARSALGLGPEPAGAATAAPIRPWHSRGPRGRPGKTAPKIEALGDRRSPSPPVPGAAGGAAELPFGVLGAGWGGARAGADRVSVGGAARTPRPLGPAPPRGAPSET